jgi:hypothetical protein
MYYSRLIYFVYICYSIIYITLLIITMGISKELFQLIKSLDKGEKTSFRNYIFTTQKDKKSNYLRLFEEIEKQKEYNEVKIRKKFQDENFVKQLGSTKNYLYETLLESLSSFHEDSYSKSRSNLHKINILLKKGLIDQARKKIYQQKSEAEKARDYFFTLELIDFEIRNPGFFTKAENGGPAYILSLSQKKDNLLSIINNLSSYRVLLLLFNQYHIANTTVRSDSERKPFTYLLANDLLQNPAKALSPEAQYLFFHIHSACNYAIRNYEKSYSDALNLFDVLKKNSWDAKEMTTKYSSVLYNIVLLSIHLKKYQLFVKYVTELRIYLAAAYLDYKVKIKLFLGSYTLELQSYIELGEFEKGLNCIQTGETFIKNNSDKVREIIFYYYCACIYLGCGKYHDALKYISKIIHKGENTGLVDNFKLSAYIVNLLIHYELGNSDHIEYAVKSTYRFLKQKNMLYKFEAVLLDFLKNKINKVYTSAGQINAFKELKGDISEVTTDEDEKEALEYFDLISWLDSKIENRSFAEIIQKKSGR